MKPIPRPFIATMLATMLLTMFWCLPVHGDDHRELNFELVSVQMRRHCAEETTVQQLEDMGVELEEPEVRYRFLARPASPMIDAKELEFTAVKPKGQNTLPEDLIELAGRSFRGETKYYSSGRGIEIDPGGRWLLIDLVIAGDQLVDLKQVKGQIDIVRGTDPETVLTGLIKDEKGFEDEKTEATVAYAMGHGSEGRHIAIEFPIPRDRVGSVEILDEDDKLIPFADPLSYQIVGRPGRDETLVKLYLTKPRDQHFRVKLQTFKKSTTRTRSFTINDVKVAPRTPEKARKQVDADDPTRD